MNISHTANIGNRFSDLQIRAVIPYNTLTSKLTGADILSGVRRSTGVSTGYIPKSENRQTRNL